MATGNPFSRALLRRLPTDASSAERAAFVARWDALEALVIAVYRECEATDDDEAAYTALRGWFAAAYPRVASALAPQWSGTRAGGRAVAEDPFTALFDRPSAAAFVGDWDAMQRLPAAREAVNRWLLDAGSHAGGATPSAEAP